MIRYFRCFCFLVDLTSRRSSILKDPFCSLNPGQVIFIEIQGEEGTKIDDKTQTNIINNPQDFIVTLYEQSINIVRIKMDCNGEYLSKSIKYHCRHAYHVVIWIDLNNNGIFDNIEKRIEHRSSINTNISQDTYHLQISIPTIDGINTKIGKHNMKIKIIPSKLYKRKCEKSSYSETRQYTVNIIPKPYKGIFISYTQILKLMSNNIDYRIHFEVKIKIIIRKIIFVFIKISF